MVPSFHCAFKHTIELVIAPGARFVAEERRVYGVGIDTASVDITEPNLPHRLLFARDVYVIENLHNLDKVPSVGAHAIVSVLKIDGASGSPARVVAILP
ncbi:hypothetical protein HPB47_009675 [Ixodes persulcatus]|uniref:Uncharacterized protein n=1 Tax=Ixodes persulcatus TaxID=34615 RepID=A0AC60P1I6_IXOPE|nr:hypothetical protein HPB47_009675 [Ixodes persulcatus]